MSNKQAKKSGLWGHRQTYVGLSGFLVLGTLPGLLGPLLILWQYHLQTDPRVLGWLALVLNGGCWGGILLTRRSARAPIAIASLLCAAAFVGLAFVAPPAPPVLRFGALVVLGVPVGAISAWIASETRPALHAAPAQIANACGAFFSAGSLLATLLLDGAYSAGWADAGPALLAVIPIAYLAAAGKKARLWKRSRATELSLPESAPPPRQNVRPLATALLTALVFLHFGNEWVLAVWLPVFLIRTFGASPAVAISMLAIHFIFLLIGRWLARTLLPIVNHRRLLLAGIVLSLGGYQLLVTANSLGTATTAVILIGLALGPVAPIAAEKLDRDLPFATGRRMLLAAVGGGLIEPWLAGYVCAGLGVKQTMLVPAFGAILACVVALLIVLESRLMGADLQEQQSQLLS